jgi:hypothetical protein
VKVAILFILKINQRAIAFVLAGRAIALRYDFDNCYNFGGHTIDTDWHESGTHYRPNEFGHTAGFDSQLGRLKQTTDFRLWDVSV